MGINRGREGSVAPKERINITYRPATKGATEEVELPLRILMLGDFTGREDPRPIEERVPVSVDKDNFDKVMAAQGLEATIAVKNRLINGGAGDLQMTLKFASLADFRPEGIVAQVPVLKHLMERRDALVALRGPLVGGNVPEFRKRLTEALRDPDKRARLTRELSLGEGAGAGPDSDKKSA